MGWLKSTIKLCEAIPSRTDDQIFDFIKKHKEFEKRWLLCETKVKISYETVSSSSMINNCPNNLRKLLYIYLRKRLFLSTDDIQIPFQNSTLFDEISFYFSKILTEVAVWR